MLPVFLWELFPQFDLLLKEQQDLEIKSEVPEQVT